MAISKGYPWSTKHFTRRQKSFWMPHCGHVRNLTFLWLCIVINSYNKTPQLHQFLKFSFGMKLCFGQCLCPSSGVFHFTHSNDICHTSLLTACEQDQDGTCMTCTTVCTVKNSWWWTEELSKTCIELYSKNKFEKLVHLVGFITRMQEIWYLDKTSLAVLGQTKLFSAQAGRQAGRHST